MENRTPDIGVRVDNEVCDTVWTRVFSRPQTEKEDELEGEGLGDCIFSVWFVLTNSFGR